MTPRCANAASPYARTAGQKNNSANGHRLPLHVRLLSTAGKLRQLGDFPLEPLKLGRDDQHVGKHDEEDNEVRSRDVLFGGGHPSTSRSSRSLMSSRFPVSSSRYRQDASARSAAHETQNAKNIRPVICGPSSEKTVGWMKSFARRMAKKLTGIKATPNNA